MPSWFDLFEIPITPASPDDEPSFAAAVRLVHAQIDAQVAAGVASEHIVVGGFSQASPPHAARCLKTGPFSWHLPFAKRRSPGLTDTERDAVAAAGRGALAAGGAELSPAAGGGRRLLRLGE